MEMLKSQVLSLLCMVDCGFECSKRIDCSETIYNFELGIKAYPDLENIGIGDTIWLEVNEPINLQDIKTERTVDYSNAANLGTSISFAELMDVNLTFRHRNNCNLEFIISISFSKFIFTVDDCIRSFNFSSILNQILKF